MKELEKEILTLKNREDNHDEAAQDIQSIECRKCKKTFPSKKHLSEHILVSHPKKLHCDHCARTFSSNYELESHAEEHGLQKNFKCDECDKLFFLEWRLNKHRNVHHENTKLCQYFSSQSRCPFEAVGCMFRHDHLSYNNDENEHHEEENESEPAGQNEIDTLERSYEEPIADKEHGTPGFSTTGLFANCAEHFLCNLCKFTSPSSAGLAEHTQRKHTQMPNQSFGFSIPYYGMMRQQANGVSYAHCGRPGGQF